MSLVLRQEPGVSPANRSTILKAIEDLRYEPNRVAGALAGNGTGAVGILINDLRNPWFVDLLDGISKQLEPASIAPLLVDSATNRRAGRSSVQILTRQRVDGIIAVGTSAESGDLTRLPRRTPVVLAGTYDPDTIGADTATNDDVAGARQATQHLLDLGHARIAFLDGPEHVGVLRQQGYREAMSAAGLSDDVLIDYAGATEAEGRAAAHRVLRSARPPTGIVAFNDLVAVGTLAAAHDLGLSTPEDISVVGYDDTFIAGIGRLGLSSVQNGTFDIGTQAAKFLFERVRGFDGPARTYIVPSVLVVRGTTGPNPNPH